MKYANPKLRLLAALIDRFICLLVLMLFVLVMSTSPDVESLLNSLLLIITLFIFFQTFWILLNSFLTSRFGGTVGKLAAGTKVVDNKGNLLSFGRVLFRNTVGYSASILVFGLGYIWIIKDKKRQAWHDMAVESYVVTETRHGLVTAILTLFSVLIIGTIVTATSIQNFTENKHLYLNLVQDAAREIQRTINEVDE